jgi:excinuclease ABC subunit C
VVLEEVQGMGPRRIDSVVNRFGSVWHLSQASVDDVCSLPNLPRSLAERVLQTVRQQRF